MNTIFGTWVRPEGPAMWLGRSSPRLSVGARIAHDQINSVKSTYLIHGYPNLSVRICWISSRNPLEMDSHRICIDMNSNVTIYHILFRIRIQILPDKIQNKYFEFGFRYSRDLQHSVIMIINLFYRRIYS